MDLLSWIEGALLPLPRERREQDPQGLAMDLRKLRADAEALRAKGRALRQRIGVALAEERTA